MLWLIFVCCDYFLCFKKSGALYKTCAKEQTCLHLHLFPAFCPALHPISSSCPTAGPTFPSKSSEQQTFNSHFAGTTALLCRGQARRWWLAQDRPMRFARGSGVPAAMLSAGHLRNVCISSGTFPFPPLWTGKKNIQFAGLMPASYKLLPLVCFVQMFHRAKIRLLLWSWFF